MNKLLSKILISVAMLGIFLLPISASLRFDNNKIIAKIENYKVLAQGSAERNANIIDVKNGYVDPNKQPDDIYGCSTTKIGSWFTNCIVKFIHFAIWKPLSVLTYYAAKLLDFFIYYSTSSIAYKNTFIDNAWATVRDVANLFFILGLLYVAIKTILGLNVSDNKKIIGGIIIIALVINFSLFATKVVIDTGNVLAKVFLNQITPVDSNGKTIDSNDDRSRSVTVSLSQSFDPEAIIGAKGIEQNLGQMTILLFLSLAMMIYMIFMFLSIAMLFVGRVASLWIAMIFSPIAFITYALHVNIPGLGFKEWSKNLIENAFMAPIFAFFIYIILLLGKSLKSITYNGTGDQGWLVNTMATVVPMLIIFVLLREAKKLTVKYSGEMGAAFSKAPMIAGLALGVGAAGLAFAGRNSIGRFNAYHSRKDGAKDYSKNRLAFDNDKTYAGKTWKEYQSDKGLKYNTWQSLGGKVNYSRAKLNETTHARDELKEYQKKAGLEGLEQYQLSGDDKAKIEKKFATEKKSEFESVVRRGDDGKGEVPLYETDYKTGKAVLNQNGEKIKLAAKGEDGFKASERNAVTSDIIANSNGNGDVETKGPNKGKLSAQGQARLRDELNMRFNAVLKVSTEELTTKKFKHLEDEAKQDISVGKRLYAGSTSGSYDARQIGPKFSTKDGLGTMALVGLTAAVAMGIRSGMKTAGANPGAGKGDFMTDMGAIISTALKNAKIKVESGEASHDDHGKGLDGHGGGGGGHH